MHSEQQPSHSIFVKLLNAIFYQFFPPIGAIVPALDIITQDTVFHSLVLCCTVSNVDIGTRVNEHSIRSIPGTGIYLYAPSLFNTNPKVRFFPP